MDASQAKAIILDRTYAVLDNGVPNNFGDLLKAIDPVMNSEDFKTCKDVLESAYSSDELEQWYFGALAERYPEDFDTTVGYRHF